jgi:hypothetical protein
LVLIAVDGRDQRAKLVHPAAHCFTADLNSALGPQFFDVANAQGEAKKRYWQVKATIRFSREKRSASPKFYQQYQ